MKKAGTKEKRCSPPGLNVRPASCWTEGVLLPKALAKSPMLVIPSPLPLFGAGFFFRTSLPLFAPELSQIKVNQGKSNQIKVYPHILWLFRGYFSSLPPLRLCGKTFLRFFVVFCGILLPTFSPLPRLSTLDPPPILELFGDFWSYLESIFFEDHLPKSQNREPVAINHQLST